MRECNSHWHEGDRWCPIDEFGCNKHTKDGISYRCKTCNRKSHNASKAKNPEGYAARARNFTRKRYHERYRSAPEFRQKLLDASKKRQARLTPQEVVIEHLLRAARQRAKRHNIPITITKADIIVPTHCPVLGIALQRNKRGKSLDTSPSLDRLDPLKGYVPGNIMVISMRANQIKSNGTLEEHQKICTYLEKYIHQKTEATPS